MAYMSPQQFFFSRVGESCETTKLSWVPQMTYCAQLLNVSLEIDISKDVTLGKEKVKELQVDEYIQEKIRLSH